MKHNTPLRLLVESDKHIGNRFLGHRLRNGQVDYKTNILVLKEEEIQSLNNSSIQADVSSNEVVEGNPRKWQPFRRRHILDGYSTEAIADISSWGEDDIQDTNKFLERADELYLKEMGKLRIWRDSYTKPDPGSWSAGSGLCLLERLNLSFQGRLHLWIEMTISVLSWRFKN
ncbi:hypothetical protein Q3G72_002455 [Acer saccharum]|nr:hypothetical protein Q3G72_002455 [Acer saccharum]